LHGFFGAQNKGAVGQRKVVEAGGELVELQTDLADFSNCGRTEELEEAANKWVRRGKEKKRLANQWKGAEGQNIVGYGGV